MKESADGEGKEEVIRVCFTIWFGDDDNDNNAWPVGERKASMKNVSPEINFELEICLFFGSDLR